ncbi:hypothetical protein TQ38_002300 [Novosphingobium sp. P6W]|nr:hypothetical protein TQ38_002300 [Novosphingobium sp. P6W]
MNTLDGLRDLFEPLTPKDDGGQAVMQLKKLQARIRAMESRFRDLEPRTGTMEEMVGRIESANEAADRLPETLESLIEYQNKLSGIERASSKDYATIENLKALSESDRDAFEMIKTEASSVLQRCETAYSAATSVGLAAAFTERSEALTKTINTWVVCLGVSLAIACGLGFYRITELSAVIDTATPLKFALNVLVSALAVGGPIWFAWLSTTQIGQRFRLSEDYAFKASVSRAYEGYRSEASRIDKDLEARLLASALSRLDELPLRVLDHRTHGSPLHELASSDVVTKALKAVPGFAGEVKTLASRALNAVETATSAASAKVVRKIERANDITDDV